MGLVIKLAIGLAAYIGLCLILRASFRQILYRPWKFLIDPRLCAVDHVELVDVDPLPDERLYVWHRAPDVEGAPVIIFFDGNRGNISIWNRRWRRIVASGAGFIAVSYRGYGGSTRRPSEEGLHEDAERVWSWAITQYPQEQLALHGFSLGSGFAAKLATKVSGVPLILEGAYISIAKRAQEMFPFLPAWLIVTDSVRTREWIGDVQGPILIAHGKKDRIVPIRHGKKLFALASEPKRFEAFAQANHLTLPINGLYPVIWDFLGYTPPAAYAERAYIEEQTDGELPPAPPIRRMDAKERQRAKQKSFVD